MKMAVECPGCGADVEIEPGHRSAEQFCARCDYPLFWVTPPRSEDDDPGGDVALRRRPGAAGLRLPATVPCPTCRELNPVIALICLRCEGPMELEPEPEPDPVPEMVPEPALPLFSGPLPEPVFWQPWVLVVAVVIGVAVFGALLGWTVSSLF